MEPRQLFQNDGNAVVLLRNIEKSPKWVYSTAKSMEKRTLYDNNKCTPKEFLLQFFSSETVDREDIKTLLARCPCNKTCKKGKFAFEQRKPLDMLAKLKEMENQLKKAPQPWYKKIIFPKMPQN